ncbi:unnamed protein product [Closterium sp. Naga37s-1]|nr:unnamed protein product [Closterium sp. Naga37s-1]
MFNRGRKIVTKVVVSADAELQQRFEEKEREKRREKEKEKEREKPGPRPSEWDYLTTVVQQNRVAQRKLQAIAGAESSPAAASAAAVAPSAAPAGGKAEAEAEADLSNGGDVQSYTQHAQRPGFVQSHGSLLFLEERSYRILAVADNIFHFFDQPDRGNGEKKAGEEKEEETEEGNGEGGREEAEGGGGKGGAVRSLLGQSCSCLMTEQTFACLVAACESSDPQLSNPILIKTVKRARPLYAIVHRTDEGLVVDVEPCVGGETWAQRWKKKGGKAAARASEARGKARSCIADASGSGGEAKEGAASWRCLNGFVKGGGDESRQNEGETEEKREGEEKKGEEEEKGEEEKKGEEEEDEEEEEEEEVDMSMLDWSALDKHERTSASIAKLQDIDDDMPKLCDTLVQELRELAGYDRVLLYRFHEDLHGEVVAEAKSDAQASLLGLHYAATDCPQVNRTMFVDVRLRLIADVTAPDVHIIQHPSLSKNINLSKSTLKGVASCHKEYCANIGIGASLVMAVVVTTRGPQSTSVRKLWGLVVCHHMSPRFLPYPQRFACDFLLQAFALQLAMELEAAEHAAERRTMQMQAILCGMLSRDVPLGLVRQSPNIKDLVPSDGAVLLHAGRAWWVGACPAEEDMKEIARWLRLKDTHLLQHTVFVTNSLEQAGLPFASRLAPAVCGLAAAMVSSRGDFLMWFRSGIERNITWAGHKDSHTVREGATMHPRNSFAAYLEVVKLQSQPWTDAEVDAMQGLRLIVKDSLPHPEPQDLKLKIQAQLNAERLTIQSQLKEVARTLENQLESAHTPIIGISSDGTVTEFNSKAAHITRRAKSEVLGSNFFSSVLAPESHAHFVAAMEVLAEGEDVQPFDVALLARSADSADAAAAADAAAGGGAGGAGGGAGGGGGKGEGVGGGELDRLVHVLVSAYGQHDRHGNLLSVRLMGQDITALKVLAGEVRGGWAEGGGEDSSIAILGGNVLSVRLMGHDLTALQVLAGEYKMPEAEARAAVDQSDLLVFTVDECGRVTEWNAAMEQTSGLPREKVVGRRLVGEVLSSNPMLLIPDQDNLVMFEIALCQALNGRDTRNHELQLKTWDGRPMDTLLHIISRRSPNGEPVGATCFMQDVVERRAAENASAMKMVAEAASQAKTMQLACLCHEIRNPLNGILSSISFMEGTEMSSDQRDLLHATSACGKYLRRVVDNVLDLSKLEEGKLEVESEPFELIHVVDAVIAQEHENASDKGLQVFCSVEPQCADVIVKGDKHRVQQIIANFFRNAVEYTQQGWVEVQLYKGSGEAAYNEYGRDALAGRLMHGQQTGQRTGQDRNVSADWEEMFPFVLCVADSGPGLSEEQRLQVFTGLDPSAAAPAISSGASDTESRSSAPAGSGLGLIVSQKLATLMNGSLSCASALSQGSSFRLSLSLPFAGHSNHADPADAGAELAAGHASLAPGGMMSCYLSNRVKGVVYTSVGVWSSAEEIAAAPVVPPSLSRNLAASVPGPTGASAAAAAAAAGAAAGRVQAGAGLSGAGLSGAGLSAPAHVTAGIKGEVLEGNDSRVFSRLASHGSEESATHAAAEDADVDAAALAAIVELEAAYGGRVMVQVLREVVDFREVAVLVEVGVMKEIVENGCVESNDGTGSNEMAIVSTQQWGSALRLGPLADALRSATKAAVVAANRTLVAAQARGGGAHGHVISSCPLTSPSLHPPSAPALFLQAEVPPIAPKPFRSRFSSKAESPRKAAFPAELSAAVSASFSVVSSRSKSLPCEPLTFSMRSLRLAVPQAAASTAPVVELAADVAEATSAVEELPLQSAEDIKAARKEEQRRKRLVQKRKLRKKGRWPPSKMKQHQNV